MDRHNLALDGGRVPEGHRRQRGPIEGERRSLAPDTHSCCHSDHTVPHCCDASLLSCRLRTGARVRQPRRRLRTRLHEPRTQRHIARCQVLPGQCHRCATYKHNVGPSERGDRGRVVRDLFGVRSDVLAHCDLHGVRVPDA